MHVGLADLCKAPSVATLKQYGMARKGSAWLFLGLASANVQIMTHNNTRVLAQGLTCVHITAAQLLKQLVYQQTDMLAGQTCNLIFAAQRSFFMDVLDCMKHLKH